jgi:hypothetical protein
VLFRTIPPQWNEEEIYLRSTLGTVTAVILVAAPALLASPAATIPDAGVNLLIGFGLVAGACLFRWRRRAH